MPQPNFVEVQGRKPPSIIVLSFVTLLIVSVVVFHLLSKPGTTWSQSNLLMIVLALLTGFFITITVMKSRLSVTVDDNGVEVVFSPFFRRRIYANEIESVGIVKGLPAQGSWWNRSHPSPAELFYVMNGGDAIALSTVYGGSVVIGTGRPDELLKRVESILASL